MILGVDNIGIASRDPEALAAFYRSIGFQITYRNERGITLEAGSAKFFMFKAAPTDGISRSQDIFSNPPGVDHISLLVDDVDSMYTALRPQSIEFISAPADQDWGARTAAFHDPEGNLVFFLRWL
jgi:catechol 2,3-dioxygenase-like lactoylglutathione lyase family enzyme